MADAVYQALDRMLPALEDLQVRGLFTAVSFILGMCWWWRSLKNPRRYFSSFSHQSLAFQPIRHRHKREEACVMNCGYLPRHLFRRATFTIICHLRPPPLHSAPLPPMPPQASSLPPITNLHTLSIPSISPLSLHLYRRKSVPSLPNGVTLSSCCVAARPAKTTFCATSPTSSISKNSGACARLRPA